MKDVGKTIVLVWAGGSTRPTPPYHKGRPLRWSAFIASKFCMNAPYSRLKIRRLNIRPMFLRDEQRIVGLTWLLELALRILTLTEFRGCQALAQTAQPLTGLNPAVPSQGTQHPTAVRLLAAFQPLYFTIIDLPGQCLRYVTSLHSTQRQILTLLVLSGDLYDRLALPP
jgi:transposase